MADTQFSRRSSRKRPFLATVVIGLLIAAGLILRPGVLLFIAIVFVVVVPLEKRFPRHRQNIKRKGLGTDITYAIVQPVLAPLGGVIGVLAAALSLVWVPGLLLRPLVALMPVLLKAVVGFLLFDMAVYWAHRAEHEVPLLWRFHSIHHSSETMDWASGIRAHPADGAAYVVPISFLVAAGFGLRFSIAIGVLKAATGLLAHANVRWQWRPLRAVIMSPEFHHWHHSSERDAINRNYSTFLPVWDVIFGTFFMPRDRHPMVYGARPSVPDGFLSQIAHPFRRRRRPAQTSPNSDARS